MKLSEAQLRSIIGTVLTEAKVDPSDAIKQIQDAVKVIIKFAPMIAQELSEAAQDAREAEVEVVGDMADRLLDLAFTLENMPNELENMVDLVQTYKTVKKVVNQGSKPKRGVQGTATYGRGEVDYMGNVSVKPGSVTKKRKR